MRWEHTLPGTSCQLCRYDKSSPKAFSKQRDVCLSCSMRGNKPRWLNISGGALFKWRAAMRLTTRQFAALAGWTHVRQARLEKQSRCNCATAEALAKALVRAIHAQHDVSRAMREWPLFAMLVDADLVARTIADMENDS